MSVRVSFGHLTSKTYARYIAFVNQTKGTNMNTNVNNLPAVVNINALPAIPTNPSELVAFTTKGNAIVSMAQRLLSQPDSQLKANYSQILGQTRQFAGLMLDAELRLADTIKAISQNTHKGIKDAYDALEISRKKWLLIKDLTRESIDVTKDEAERKNDIPTRYRALQLTKEIAKKKMEAEQDVEIFDVQYDMEPVQPVNGKYEVVWVDLSATTASMTTEIIKSISAPIADNAVLFMWADKNKLPDAFTIMESWGFKYSELAIWNKDRLGVGNWTQNVHETMLIGTKGAIQKPESIFRFPSIYHERRTDHAVRTKPDYYYATIEQMCPNKACLEMFSNRKYSPKWTTFNEQ
jgi:N6-adenosine-specific RNA methylase IME4